MLCLIPLSETVLFPQVRQVLSRSMTSEAFRTQWGRIILKLFFLRRSNTAHSGTGSPLPKAFLCLLSALKQSHRPLPCRRCIQKIQRSCLCPHNQEYSRLFRSRRAASGHASEECRRVIFPHLRPHIRYPQTGLLLQAVFRRFPHGILLRALS